MSHPIPGLHHVTALCSAPQANVEFYVETLGQRFVKKTVNFDSPDVYHLYYGDPTGSPGTILTFFAFVGAGPGRAGPRMASAVSYGVPAGGLKAWMLRFAEEAIDFNGPAERFGQQMISVRDPDGLTVELIETAGVRVASAEPANEGLHSVTLWLDDPEPTARVLGDLFGYEADGEMQEGSGVRHRLVSPAKGRGAIVDLVRSNAPSISRQGAGTIHHVAFRAESNDVQLEWRERLLEARLDVTPVIDRQYFKAIYFREPGGILFEIATDPPGFGIDEPAESLGQSLMLPPRYEVHRSDIERVLPTIRMPR